MSETTRVRALLVDDEPLARDMIREMLLDDPSVDIVSESVNGREAVEAIKQHSPDVLFLDVQMPARGGLEVLESLQTRRLPHVIFVTAYDQYAVRAFELHALDYLLKPFDRERFAASWQRARARVMREKHDDVDERVLALLKDLKAGADYLKRLAVKTGGRVFFLNTVEIDWIEAEGPSVAVHSGGQRHVIRETISALEEQLDPKDFLRIHRSAIVRIDRIRELQLSFHGEHRVIMQDGTQLKLSPKHREKLQEVIGRFP